MTKTKTRKSNFRQTVAVLAVSALALAGLGGSAASAAAATPTKVTITAESGGFYGAVKSSKLECKSERTVLVFKQLGAKQRPGTDERVAMDTTGEDGEWNIGNPGLRSGRYYARAVRTPDCLGASSITLRAQQ
ncbi:MAG: hypothetical protein QOE75_2775 [Solirubrobacterales bacterium]|jgi:hypothetical protein|nr:hypothetical protein [Solirubrobacterales bacterium]